MISDTPMGKEGLLGRILIPLLLLAALPAQAIECSFGDDGMTVTWEPVEGQYQYLEIWYSPEEIEDSGIALATLEPDGDGVFPTEAVIPPSFVVNPEECIGCGICVQQCPTDAIELVDLKAVIDPEACISCGICAQGCPTDAIYAPGAGDHFALVGVGTDGAVEILERL